MSKLKDTKRIRRGQTVFWMSHPSEQETQVATVLEVGVEDSLTLFLVTVGGVGVKDGVRHYTDPVLKDSERNTFLLAECGCYRTVAEEYAAEDARIEREELRAMEQQEREEALAKQLATA